MGLDCFELLLFADIGLDVFSNSIELFADLKLFSSPSLLLLPDAGRVSMGSSLTLEADIIGFGSKSYSLSEGLSEF